MPSYVITKNGARLHLYGRWGQTLCGRRIGTWWNRMTNEQFGRQTCVKCLDRAARMSKREE